MPSVGWMRAMKIIVSLLVSIGLLLALAVGTPAETSHGSAIDAVGPVLG